MAIIIIIIICEDKVPEKPGHLFREPDPDEIDQNEEYEILEITHSGDESTLECVQLKVSTKDLVNMQKEQQKYVHIHKMIKKHPNKLGMLCKIREDNVLVKIV